MQAETKTKTQLRLGGALAVSLLLSACGGFQMGDLFGDKPQAVGVTLSGAQEVPPVATNASGRAEIQIRHDRQAISGTVHVSDVAATAAHIHQAPIGVNGPVVIPLVSTGNGRWAIPDNTRLTAPQYTALMNNQLYINVHSVAYPNGEIRGQIIVR